MTDSVGQPIDRVDGRLKVTGAAMYTADQQFEGVVYAVLLTSAIAKGRVASLDTTVAEKLPGIVGIFSHKNKLPLAKDPGKVDPSSPADRALQLLQSDRIYYGNQPVALAVADTLERAKHAVEQIVVRYEHGAPSIDFENARWRSYIPKKIGGAGDPAQTSRGDVQTAFHGAESKVQQVYRTPFYTHSPMEPHATTAVWEGNDKLTLYDTSQGIFGDRKRISELLGLSIENVRVVCLFVGGGFGSKGPTWSHSAICAMVARHVRRPVKLVLERPQMFGPVGCRSETLQAISASASKDGKLVSLANDTLTHTSTFDEFTESATTPTRMLYSVPNNATVQRLVRSDIGTPSYTRAPGEAPGSFSLEVAMDELAYELEMDPMEFRIRNYAERDENKNLPWSGKALLECYRQGATKFGWNGRVPEPRSMKKGGKLIGWGMATSLYPARRSPASARARMYPDGRVLVEAGTQDLGGGTYTIMTQIAADALGVPVEKVIFLLGDTRLPETPVSGGSQTAATAGSAVFEAASALKRKVAAMSPADWQGKTDIEAESSTEKNPAEKEFSMYSFGAQFVEVQIDAMVGSIHVTRMTGVFDAGTILNPKTARSQFMGGMVWGIGMALHEDTVYDPVLARIVNNNLAEYHVPTNADVGEFDISWIDGKDTHVSPMGAKGIGEIGITGAAAAICNAVYHATGIRVRELPITPDKLMGSHI